MSYACLVLGESGTGKTCSLRNLDPKKTLLIQPVRKPLPFRSAGWKEIREKGDGGNIIVTDDSTKIVKYMMASPFEIIVIDDWQYILSFQYMHSAEKKMTNGEVFEFYKRIGNDGFKIVEAASLLAEHKRVYVLAHTAVDDFGNVKIKTLGKLLDDKVVVEGLFTTVLRTRVENGKYTFQTQNSGQDTVKSPMGMFNENFIDNDLSAVDQIICDYYGINEENQQ